MCSDDDCFELAGDVAARIVERLAGEARGSPGVNPAGRAAGSSAAILQFVGKSRIGAAVGRQSRQRPAREEVSGYCPAGKGPAPLAMVATIEAM